ncbi:hypothetical protein D9M72_559360 [compost metagenome]
MGPNSQGLTPSAAASPATTVPLRMAMNVAPSIQAFARGSSLRSRWSGRMPYLTGPKSAEMAPNRKSATSSTAMEEYAIPTTATAAAASSQRFSLSATTALSNLSAIWPPSAEKSRNGAMKTAPASVTSDPASFAATVARMRKTSVFLRKLSLNAERNCVQKSGANRREVMRLFFTERLPFFERSR